MAEEIELAVAFALDPQTEVGTKSQATAFCEQVKVSPEGWRVCLELTTKEQPKSSEQARFFALQVIEDTLRHRYSNLNASQKLLLRTTLWNLVISSTDSVMADPSYLKNKMAVVLVLLLKHHYPIDWPSFFEDLLSALSVHASSPLFVEFFLRIMLSMDEEIVCLYIQRSHEETARNSDIKDALRAGPIIKLAETWFNILVSYASTPDIANACLRVIALYVSWIDINLVVTRQFIHLLYQLLSVETTRDAACECMTEIVYKGMSKAEKVELIKFLGVMDVLERLGPVTNDPSDESTVEFRERVAKLINMVGTELYECWMNEEASALVREEAFAFIHGIFPHFLKFLADEYDDVSSCLFSFMSAYISLLKKLSKPPATPAMIAAAAAAAAAAATSGKQQANAVAAAAAANAQKSSIPEHLKANFISLLRALIVKMKFDPEDDGMFGEECDDDEAAFIEMRKNLKVHFENLNSMDEVLFASFVPAAVCSTFDTIATKGMEAVPWVDAELAIHLLFIYGEACKGPVTFFEEENKSNRPTALGQMIISMLKSNISAYPHISIAPIYFETICRYTSFFEVNSHFIPDVLSAFVDKRGLHHPNAIIRSRLFYLFLRFTKSIKTRLLPFMDNLLMSIQDLLIVSRPIFPKPAAMAKKNELKGRTSFDSQLYIFEAVGVLISMEGVNPLKQVEYLTAVVNPILASIQEVMEKELYKNDSPPDDTPFTTYLHNLITTLGAISKGFPDITIHSAKTGKLPAWSGVFKNSLLCVMAVLERLSSTIAIREASRNTFQKMVNCMGTDILPYIQPLINAGLLSSSSTKELVDFIPFISLVTFRFKPDVFPVLDNLFKPLMERIFYLLNQPPTGTDEAIAQADLRRAYLSLISAFFGNDMERIFISDENGGSLNTIMQSVLHYAQDINDIPLLKNALGVLMKMVIAWGGGVDTMNLSKIDVALKAPLKKNAKSPSSHANVDSTSILNSSSSSDSSQMSASGPQPPPTPKVALPGFDQFLYSSIVPILFEIPRKICLKDAQSMLLVMGEIANFHRIVFWGAKKEEYAQFLTTVFFPSVLQCPQDVTLSFVDALRTKDGKAFRKYLQEFYKPAK